MLFDALRSPLPVSRGTATLVAVALGVLALALAACATAEAVDVQASSFVQVESAALATQAAWPVAGQVESAVAVDPTQPAFVDGILRLPEVVVFGSVRLTWDTPACALPPHEDFCVPGFAETQVADTAVAVVSPELRAALKAATARPKFRSHRRARVASTATHAGPVALR